jgi:hypothetical protein
MKYSTVGYDPMYIKMLLTSNLFKTLAIAIREIPSDTPLPLSKSHIEDLSVFPAITWILTHNNLALGLLSTVNSHRRQGFAKVAALQLISIQRDYFQSFFSRTEFRSKDQDEKDEGVFRMPSYCFVEPYNVASMGMFKGLGARVTEGLTSVWMGGEVQKVFLPSEGV